MKSSIFAAAAAALCCLGLLSGCGGGGAGSPPASGNTPQVAPPTATIKADSGATAGASGTALQGTVGTQIVLESASTAAAGATITGYQWTIVSKPDGSRISLSAATSSSTSFVPDVGGSYSLQLQVTDSVGQTATQIVAIAVSVGPPVAVIVAKVVFGDTSSVRPAQAVATGAVITLDASAALAAAGADNPVAISWALTAAPAGSSSSLVTTAASAHFTADVTGEYQVTVHASHAAGDYVDVVYVFDAAPPPTAVLVAQSGTSGNGSFAAYVNYSIVLDASGSTGPAGDTLTKGWSWSSKPAGSLAQLSAATGNLVNFTADVAGDYVVTLRVIDTNTGVVAAFTETIHATVGPTAVVTGNASPVPVISAPTFVAAPGEVLTLRGSGSYEPGGGTLTYLWSVASRPAGSSASITTPTAQNVTFTPDVAGAYTVTLTVSDTQGYSSQQTATINVGAYAPIAIVDQPSVNVLLGGAIQASAALSYDPDSLPLSYSWSVDARPSGSTATIASPANAVVSFTPDVAGSYSLTVTVGNGTVNSVATVAVTAFAASSGTIPLTYLPLQAAYSRATDKLVIVSTNPNALHIVDPTAATDVNVALPTGVKALALSPDGKLAAVLHEGVVSLVDLQSPALIKSSLTGGSQTMVAVNNAGLLYLLGQTGGQWVTPPITIEDGRTGTFITPGYSPFAVSYGTMNGIYSDVNNKLFVIASGLSPAEIYHIDLDPSSGNTVGSGQAPYWGDYPMAAPLWLSGDQSLLFTAAGTYFSTANLAYVGTFSTSVLSMSHSLVTQEAAVLPSSSIWGSPTQYPSAYKRFTGSLLFPAADVPLPLLGGQQSYGLQIFHNSTGGHVMVVQTGTSQANGAGANYFVIVR